MAVADEGDPMAVAAGALDALTTAGVEAHQQVAARPQDPGELVDDTSQL